MAVAGENSWRDVMSHSPWYEQLDNDTPPCPLDHDVTTDVAIIGAGIAGAATAFFVLRETDRRVLVIEGRRAGFRCDRAQRGAGRQLLRASLVRARRRVRVRPRNRRPGRRRRRLRAAPAHARRERSSTVRMERVAGHMGMFSGHHLEVHLRNQALRRRGRLATEEIVVAEDAPFIDQIPAEYSELYTVVPRNEVDARLGCRPRSILGGAVLTEGVHQQRARRAGHARSSRPRVPRSVPFRRSHARGPDHTR